MNQDSIKNTAFDPYTCYEAEIVERSQESRTIFNLDVRIRDEYIQNQYSFQPGQFNMLYLYGVGEIAISIISDPEEKNIIRHTIRSVGRVTKAMEKLQPGASIGIRGPYGHGWPMKQVFGKDIVIITGGLGCAPSVSIINYIISRRQYYGNLKILQGIKHSEDFIFRKQYEKWQQEPHTEIHIAADQAGPKWPWSVGYVTDMIKILNLHPENTVAMMCGPEMMMHTAIRALVDKGVKEENMYLSMERNMECGIGHCGHCQYGGLFICKDGPIFAYPKVKALFHESGF